MSAACRDSDRAAFDSHPPFQRAADSTGELLACAAAAVALVLLRSAVFVLYEQLFDSDQAIVGLMAKHASELRGFPLFFYGQNYMLGVQAWIAVPFFWAGGPTVAMLRLPLVLINAAVVVALIVAFARGGVRPLLAFVWATYWDCYLVDFLARERVVLASTDVVRIAAYQARVDRNRANAAIVRRAPCAEGTRVADWCVTDPFNR